MFYAFLQDECYYPIKDDIKRVKLQGSVEKAQSESSWQGYVLDAICLNEKILLTVYCVKIIKFEIEKKSKTSLYKTMY